eukprot:9645175-Alexandrium_andersonii.AAC.1
MVQHVSPHPCPAARVLPWSQAQRFAAGQTTWLARSPGVPTAANACILLRPSIAECIPRAARGDVAIAQWYTRT